MTKRLALLALLAGVLVAVPGPHDSAGAAFAGKNGRIAFYRFLPGHGNRIFTVAPSGKALTQRTFGGPNDVHPSWAPDGTRIAFTGGGDQDDGLPFHIHTVTLATGKTTQLTSGRVQDLLPAWQPL